jgi:hypothetical protein
LREPGAIEPADRGNWHARSGAAAIERAGRDAERPKHL